MNTSDEKLESKIRSKQKRIYITLRLLEKLNKPNLTKKERCHEQLSKQLNSVNRRLKHLRDFHICRLCSGPINMELSDSQPYHDICKACSKNGVRHVPPDTQYVHRYQEGRCYFVQPQ
jgi:hypothetical protein